MGDFGTLAMMASTGLGMAQSSQQAKAQQSAVMARQRADIQQREYQMKIKEREERDRLKRAQATQRARYGASGLASGGGSASALLEGLRKKSEESIAEMRNLNSLQTQNLKEETTGKKRINLLDFKKNQTGAFAGMVNLLEKN